MRQRIDRADRHERAFKGRQAVEYGREEHEAERGVIPDLVPGAVEGQQGICSRYP
jgi:hypothetical protein